MLMNKEDDDEEETDSKKKKCFGSFFISELNVFALIVYVYVTFWIDKGEVSGGRCFPSSCFEICLCVFSSLHP